MSAGWHLSVPSRRLFLSCRFFLADIEAAIVPDPGKPEHFRACHSICLGLSTHCRWSPMPPVEICLKLRKTGERTARKIGPMRQPPSTGPMSEKNAALGWRMSPAAVLRHFRRELLHMRTALWGFTAPGSSHPHVLLAHYEVSMTVVLNLLDDDPCENKRVTVCEQARYPNVAACWTRRHAMFMATPARAPAHRGRLQHVVTSVDRGDLADAYERQSDRCGR